MKMKGKKLIKTSENITGLIIIFTKVQTNVESEYESY